MGGKVGDPRFEEVVAAVRVNDLAGRDSIRFLAISVFLTAGLELARAAPIGVIGDRVTTRGIALDEIDESRKDAMGWPIRSWRSAPRLLTNQSQHVTAHLKARPPDRVVSRQNCASGEARDRARAVHARFRRGSPRTSGGPGRESCRLKPHTTAA